MRLDPSDREDAIFGLFDGLVSSIGIVAVLIMSGHPGAIIPAIIGGTLAASVGMGAGTWLSTPDRNIGASLITGGSTAAGGISLSLPFALVSSRPAAFVCAGVAALIGITIGALRKRGRRGYIETGIILAAAAVVTISAGVLLGGSA